MSMGSHSRRAGVWRYAWASPATLLGLAATALACATGATVRRVDDVLEVAGGRTAGWLARVPGSRRFVAMTLGHVVLGASHETLAAHRAHEHEHVRQYERWGVFFFPGYLASSAIHWVLGNDPYWHNGFECKAREAARRHEEASALRAGTHPE